jgi:hypothetical protein
MFGIDHSHLIYEAVFIVSLIVCILCLIIQIRAKILESISASIFLGVRDKRNR